MPLIRNPKSQPELGKRNRPAKTNPKRVTRPNLGVAEGVDVAIRRPVVGNRAVRND